MHSYPITVYFLSLCCSNPPIQTSPYIITSLIDSCQRKPCMVCPAPAAPLPTPAQLLQQQKGPVQQGSGLQTVFAASDLLPRRWQPWKLHYHHQPSRWPWGLHGSAREVALFHVCLRYASLNITCYFIVLFTIRLWVSSKLMVKLEFLNGCGVHIGAAINSIYLLSG